MRTKAVAHPKPKVSAQAPPTAALESTTPKLPITISALGEM